MFFELKLVTTTEEISLVLQFVKLVKFGNANCLMGL